MVKTVSSSQNTRNICNTSQYFVYMYLVQELLHTIQSLFHEHESSFMNMGLTHEHEPHSWKWTSFMNTNLIVEHEPTQPSLTIMIIITQNSCHLSNSMFATVTKPIYVLQMCNDFYTICFKEELCNSQIFQLNILWTL